MTTGGLGLSAGVASDEPILNRSCWIAFRESGHLGVVANRPRKSERRVQLIDRAVALDASGPFDTRTPPARLVSPPSPRIVLMLLMSRAPVAQIRSQ